MTGAHKKFLFDLNKFDEPDTSEIEEKIIEEDIEPPPPTFSEDELEAAKAVAFTQGKSEGIQEERGKREQELTVHMGVLAEQIQTLFASELYREKAYEQEAINLSLQLVDQLSPLLEEKLGLDTIRKVIEKTVMAQSKQSQIIIEVAPDYVEEISTLMDRIRTQEEDAPQFKVKANETLTKGACALSWKDGGMVRDPQGTAKAIKKELEDLLESDKTPENKDQDTGQNTENAEETIPAPPNDGINKEKDSSTASDNAPPQKDAETPSIETKNQTGDSHE
ncbi:MAG: hypothetical protein AAF988_07670 [Pseudomonadota bacterium]